MGTPAAVRVWTSHWVLYKRIWVSNAIGSLLQPFLYLLGMGVGVGAMVDRGTSGSEALGGVSYFAFLAPALLATTAMMTAVGESLWPVLDGFTWGNGYRAMVSTPLRPRDVVSGVGLWNTTRTAIGCGAVALVLLGFDDTRTPMLVPALAAAVLTGAAFTFPLLAWSSTRESANSFPAIMRFVVVPMFLFAGAFFPIDQLPAGLRPFAVATPLYHGVELCRGLVLDQLSAGRAAIHVSVIAAYAIAGWIACLVTFRRRLET